MVYNLDFGAEYEGSRGLPQTQLGEAYSDLRLNFRGSLHSGKGREKLKEERKE